MGPGCVLESVINLSIPEFDAADPVVRPFSVTVTMAIPLVVHLFASLVCFSCLSIEISRKAAEYTWSLVE